MAWRDETASPLARKQPRLLHFRGYASGPDRENSSLQNREKSAALPAAVATRRPALVDSVMTWSRFSDHAKAAIRKAEQAASVDRSCLPEVVHAEQFLRARGQTAAGKHRLPTLVVAGEEREERVAVEPGKPEEGESSKQ